MKRNKIIEAIGQRYFVSNVENDEWSYSKALKRPISGHQFLDIRFFDIETNVAVLVETKARFATADEKQLFDYVKLEKEYGTKHIVAILADTKQDRIKVWKNDEWQKYEISLRTFVEYVKWFDNTKINDKQKVMQATYDLNELLHNYIDENIRAQFVGTCLLSLNKRLQYKGLSNAQIRAGIKSVLENLLNNKMNKAEKIALLNSEVLETDEVRRIPDNKFIEILDNINANLLPYINDATTIGQDLLNLFFTTFNKYVGKSDKNQAFTPDHIVHFMCKVAKVDKNSVILDPTCGSGAFLVQAMTQALKNCSTVAEQDRVKENQVFGIEVERKAYGLSTTNMLIHGDGNSNVYQSSCFDKLNDLKDKGINIVLMNPPYNATVKHVPEYISKEWNVVKKGKEKATTDPSKGFCFVYETAKVIKTGKLLCLLPLSCAIGSDNTIAYFKRKMLQEHTLDAVFTLPKDTFHPGSNAQPCCMVFTLGKPHPKYDDNYKTFFGYFRNDGLVKKKNLGRVDVKNQWEELEKQWLDLYQNLTEKPGLAVRYNIADDNPSGIYDKEWLAEAYMETDYSSLSDNDFTAKIRDYISFLFKTGKAEFTVGNKVNSPKIELNTKNWQSFIIGGENGIFTIQPAKGETTDLLISGDDIPYIAAKNEINGLSKMCSSDNPKEWISSGNCIIFIQIGDGSAGYTTYQPEEFIGMNGKISCGYNPKLNKYSGIFISTVLDLERPKYCFGRSWTGDKLKNTYIKLPAKNNTIDWDYMEKYIKQLPYGDLL